MTTIRVDDEQLTIGSDSFSIADIDEVTVVMKLYAAPLTRFDRFRNGFAGFAAQFLEFLIRVGLLAVSAGMAAAVVLTVADLFEFETNDAMPLIVVCVLLFGFFGWRLGGLFAADVCGGIAAALSVSGESTWFHILMVRSNGEDRAALAGTEFHKIDELRELIGDAIDTPPAELQEIRLPPGNWVTGERIELHEDRIQFRPGVVPSGQS